MYIIYESQNLYYIDIMFCSVLQTAHTEQPLAVSIIIIIIIIIIILLYLLGGFRASSHCVPISVEHRYDAQWTEKPTVKTSDRRGRNRSHNIHYTVVGPNGDKLLITSGAHSSRHCVCVHRTRVVWFTPHSLRVLHCTRQVVPPTG